MTEKPERILKFILARKKPVTAKMIAQRFLITPSTAGMYLRRFHGEGHITREEVGREIVWAKKEGASLPVAVPEPTTPTQPSKPTPVEREQPKVIWPTSTFQTSYPHVRGYDD